MTNAFANREHTISDITNQIMDKNWWDVSSPKNGELIFPKYQMIDHYAIILEGTISKKFIRRGYTPHSVYSG